MNNKIKTIIRYIVAFISVLAIVYMGSDIDISNYSKENLVPLTITSLVVSSFKAIIIFVIIIFIKKVINKIQNKK